METIKFTKLKIQNFKSISNMSVDLSNETVLRGPNGAGKTTIADAIWWTLFNKDSNGASNSTIKPLDAFGKEVEKLITEVTLEVTVSGLRKIFTRRQQENWVKERGSTEAIYKGNVQKLFYNESEMKTAEFSNEVNSIIDEDKFKLLTTPKYFMSLEWKQRRESLLQMLSNSSEEQINQILKSKPEYFDLVREWTTDINSNKDFNMFYDFLKSKSRQNNQELELIPARIQSLQASIDQEDDENQLNALLSGYKKELADLESSVSKKSTDEPQHIKDKVDKISQMRILSENARNSYDEQVRTKTQELMIKRSDIQMKVERLKAQLTLESNDALSLKNKKAELELRRKELLEKYYEVKDEQFVKSASKTNCSLCGQQLPEEQIANHEQKEFESWSANVKKRLDEITEEGNSVKIKVASVDQQLEDINSSNKQQELNELVSRLETLVKVEELTFDDGELKRSQEIDKEISKLKQEVDAYRLSDTSQSQSNVNSDRKNQLPALISDTDRRIGKLEQVKRNKEQIALYEKQEVELRTQKTRFEVLVNIAQDFEKEKNEMFEKLLSDKFGGTIQWRLFEKQINGGFKPTCDAYLNGVPYQDQSSGQKIFTGIEIIKAFQDRYEVECPVIIDNRETITLPLQINSQTISMFVDETNNELVILS